jgi:Cu(I)/Ag(I) efflux system membrane fusion protein
MNIPAKIPGGSRLWVFIIVIVISFAFGYFLRSGEPKTKQSGHEQVESIVKFWTCSMHPQIQQPGPGQCPLCGMDLIPVSDNKQGGDARSIQLSPAAIKLASITTAPVERKRVRAEIRLDGKIDYDETRVAQITAWVPGRIERLFVDFTGETVKKGDHLVELYSPELIAAQQELLIGVKMLESTSIRLKESSRRNVDATREKLRLWGLTDRQIRKIERSGTTTNQITIYSPLSGIVIEKNGVEGMYVKTGSPIYMLADLSQVWVKLDAYESDLALIRNGQDVSFETRALPGEDFSGTIVFIDPVVNTSTRTVAVRVNVSNPEGKLKPGMFVSARVHSSIEADEAPLVIPVTAPLITGRRAVVYVADPQEEGLFAGREIVLGPRAGGYYIVREGLQEGERVVTNGNFKIDSAVQIMAKPSMMNPEGGASSSGHNHGQPSAAALEPLQTLPTPKAFKQQLDNTSSAYFVIQQALSSDNQTQARVAAKHVLETLDSVDMALLKGPAHMAWMQQLGEAQTAAKEMVKAQDISGMRAAFETLSDTLYASIKQFGTSGNLTIHRFHCPMAFNNRGAYWLQQSEETENPYYGSMMYRCGTKTETLAIGTLSKQEHDHE